MPKKGRSTQALANAYPPWSNIRKDEQSIGFQFLNVIGQQIDDLRKQKDRIGDNYFIGSSIVSDIDVYYQLQLPGDFVFTKEDNDDTELLFTPPSVSGVIDGVSYSVTAVKENDIEGFWYNPAPSRISLGAISSGEHLIASGYLHLTPFNPLTDSGLLHIPNKLTVTLSGGSSYIGFEDNDVARRGLVYIEGVTRAGLNVTEQLVFVHDDTLKTQHEFKSLKKARVYGVNKDTETFLVITSASFNKPDYPVVYQLDETFDKEEMPLFWAIGSGISPDQRTLDLVKYDADDLSLRLEGFVEKHPIMQQELLDVTGSGAIVPLDLAVEPRSNNIWVVDSGSLYLYSSDLPYPDTSKLLGKQYDANSVIEPNTYYCVLGEEVELNYVWVRPNKGMVRHRVWVEQPDGILKSIENGSLVTYHTDESSWVFGEPKGNRSIRNSDILPLNQRGEWIFSLEVQYADGTTSIDKRIVSVLGQNARAKFDLSSIGIPNTIVGIDFDSEYKLWVLDSAGGKYEINRHYDLMIIDFSKKIIYFREPYEQVRVF